MLNNPPQLSIIIPTNNSESTLEEALKSIFIQTFNNYEVLIIDNLSMDNTSSIVQEYQNKYQNIKWFSSKDNGVYDAMNKGVDLARGNWVYFLGSDDTLYECQTLEKVFNELNFSAQVIYGNVFFEEYNRIYDYEFNNYKLTTNNICHQSIFFKKEVFCTIGKFNTKYKMLADWDHNMRWFFSNKVNHKYVNQVIANFAAGGYSSKNKDFVFENVKYFKILKLAIFKLTLKELIETCNKALKYFKTHGQTKKYKCFKVFKCCFVVLRKLNRINK